MSLKEYHRKRNFKKTTEPKGRVKKRKTKLLYIIQKHAASHLHYDFRLELHSVLKSWAVPKGPSLDSNVKRLAMHVEDHPVEYGSFEGIIPEGEYGGGTVMLWDQGEWLPQDEDPYAAYKKGNMTFLLKGKKLKGLWKLIWIKKTPNSWLLMKLNDKYAKPQNKFDITTKNKSVKSKQSMEQLTKNYKNVWTKSGSKKSSAKKSSIKKDPAKPVKKNFEISLEGLKAKKAAMPKNIKPQLATLVEQPPAGDNWLHEIKFDGYRLIAYINNKDVKLITRGNQNWTEKFPNVATGLAALNIGKLVLDGEVVVLDAKQHSRFQLLQNSIEENKSTPFIYYVFDLIYLNGYDLSSVPLQERKRLLHQIIPSNVDSTLRYSDHVPGSGAEVFRKICKLGLEGIVSKEINSPYLQKRSRNWLKSKCIKRQEFVVGGYAKPKGGRAYFGSLLIGYYADGELIYSGHVGTGFNEKSLKEMYALLKKYRTTENPFSIKPPGIKKVTWVKPVLVVEIEYTEITNEGILRHPSFKGIRKDKPAKNITLEQPQT